MLSLLHIENIAVVEQADIAFGSGFNVLSGETGAGKSIIIDAISAILGERTYRESIRTGADKAFVSAVFYGIPQMEWFEENHVAYDEELLIQREIFLDGRNICKVNGQGVTVSVLRALGSRLISIHGQHDSRQLFEEDRHLELLDSFSGDEEQRHTYGIAYEKVRSLQAEVDRLSLDESEKLRRQDLLQHQIDELERAALRPGEDKELEQRLALLVNAEKLMHGIQEAVGALYGDEGTQGAIDLIAGAERSLAAIVRFGTYAASLHSKVQELVYTAQDVAEEVRDYRDGFSYSEEELERISDRLDLIRKLRRKYGDSCEAMLQYLEKAGNELDEIVFADERRAQAEKELHEARLLAEEAAEQLRSMRKSSAVRLEEQIRSELAQLNMPGIQFSCDFVPTALTPSGTDFVRFLMSANAGEALKPLSRVASGGELARIMLALKNVLAKQDSVTTMIFDEVDAGVSGRAAQKVAEKLLSVSRGRQVLCVTHLPQIAALAETHLLITKNEKEGRTFTKVTTLDFEGRKAELARMIGGARITQNTLISAEEMLRQS